jgi:hypothetical protein
MSEPASSNPDSNIMEPLRVQTQLKSRYTVFDASGRLPFDLVFGLRRRSDSDPRDISFQITKSFLDVPYTMSTMKSISAAFAPPQQTTSQSSNT